MGVRTKLVAFEAGSRAVGANGKTRFGMAEIAAAIAAIVIVAVPRAVTGADRAFSALSGSWTGSGVVKWTNGGSERVRCRSVYEPAAGAQLNLRLSCAGDSYNFDLSANISYEGGPIAGTWNEASRNISGNIAGRSNANGSQIQATVQGMGLSANLSVSTRGARQTVMMTAPGTDVSEASIAMEPSVISPFATACFTVDRQHPALVLTR